MVRCLVLWFFVAGIIQYAACSDPEIEEEELRARDFMALLNKETEEEISQLNYAEWDYATSLTEEQIKRKIDLAAEVSAKSKKRWEEVKKFNWKTFSDPALKRQFMLYSILGPAVLPKDEIIRLEKISADMEKIYSTAKICDYNDKTKCDISLDPDIVDIHAKSRDEGLLKHVWVSWRNAVGPQLRHLYRDYVHMMNKVAHLNNFNSTDIMWLFPYEECNMKDIRSQLKNLWEQVKPLYQQMHAYIRYRLHRLYGNIVPEKGPIPAHLLGNVWAQSWANIASDFEPYPEAVRTDVTENMKRQNYTAVKIFKTAEDFFVSLGLPPMIDSFWEKSIFTKPTQGQIVCHASAWDFKNRKDFRIKMCTTITEENFYVVHHEMGHVQYFMHYKDQPYQFRSGANPGFHEAVGDVIALSVKSPKHLERIGLSSVPSDDTKVILNNLFLVGATKIAMLPFAYLLDNWRWSVFSGNTTFDDYNCKWWELRESIQGVEPPVPRTEADFDAASKYHVSAGTPYIRYFVALILEFQLHRSLCEKAGEYDPNDPQKPLHLCDIYGHKEAGEVLKGMLTMGNSRPWPEILHFATGQRFLDASAFLEYFHPLQSWLEKENRKNGVHIGWEKSTIGCTKEARSETDK